MINIFSFISLYFAGKNKEAFSSSIACIALYLQLSLTNLFLFSHSLFLSIVLSCMFYLQQRLEIVIVTESLIVTESF